MDIIIHGDVIINGPINYNHQPVNDTQADEFPVTEDDFEDDLQGEEKASCTAWEFSDLQEEIDILDSIAGAEGDFLFECETGTSKIHSWRVSGDGDFVCNVGIESLRLSGLAKYNKRVDIAVTKDVALALRDFLNGLCLTDDDIPF